jgi:hypothetical protein
MKLQWPGQDKEKGRREKATRGTSVGFKLCECPRNRDQRWGGQMIVWEPLQKRWGAGKHSLMGLPSN